MFRSNDLARRRAALRSDSHAFLATGLILFGLFTTPAYAVDGLIEISHACAAQTGCFSGDAAGYPVTIDGSSGRSYRLTSDLLLQDEDTTGIEIDARAVSIDLNGFRIVRADCADPAGACPRVAGVGRGVIAHEPGTRLENGYVIGAGLQGVFLRSGASVVGLHVSDAFVHGIYVEDESLVAHSTLQRCGDTGIVAGDSARILHNAAAYNQGRGIHAGSAALVRENVTSHNGSDGIDVAFGSQATDNVSYHNSGDGLDVAAGSLVQRNTAYGNIGYGLKLSATAAYLGNVVNGNATGTVDGGRNMFGNSCNGAATCP